MATKRKAISRSNLTDAEKGRRARRLCVKCSYTLTHRPGEILCHKCQVGQLPKAKQESRRGPGEGESRQVNGGLGQYVRQAR
jgi:hypothetical protein